MIQQYTMHIFRISTHDFNTVGQTPNVLEVVKNGKQATSKDLLLERSFLECDLYLFNRNLWLGSKEI